MEIKLNVTEEKFNEVLQKELDAFSPEELHDIVGECIKQKLMEDELISNLLVYEDKYYYGGKKPSRMMEDAAKQVDLSSAYKEIQDKMISYMKENYQDMMIKVMSNIILNGLTSQYQFQESISNAIRTELIRSANN